MKAGLPVICTDVGDIKRVIKHGRNGFIVPNCTNSFKIVEKVGEYVHMLKEDTELYASLSVNAYESVIKLPPLSDFKDFIFGNLK